MTEERNRTLKMLAEGKISVEETTRLLDAMQKQQANHAFGPDFAAGPRLSRLALFGVLGVPVGIAAGLLASGLGIAFGAIEARALAGGFIVAAAVMAVGLVLSIAGRIVIRKNPEQLCGLKAARAGIVLPLPLWLVGLTLTVSIATWLENQANQKWMRKTQRDREEAMAEAGAAKGRQKEEEKQRRENAEKYIQGMANAVDLFLMDSRTPGRRLTSRTLDPAWSRLLTSGDLPDTKGKTVAGEMGIFSVNPLLLQRWQRREKRTVEAQVSDDLKTGTLILKDEDITIRIPVAKTIRKEGYRSINRWKPRGWRFIPGPVKVEDHGRNLTPEQVETDLRVLWKDFWQLKSEVRRLFGPKHLEIRGYPDYLDPSGLNRIFPISSKEQYERLKIEGKLGLLGVRGYRGAGKPDVLGYPDNFRFASHQWQEGNREATITIVNEKTKTTITFPVVYVWGAWNLAFGQVTVKQP